MPKIRIESDNGKYLGEPIEVPLTEFDESDDGRPGSLDPDVRDHLWPEIVTQLEAAVKAG